MTWFRLLTLLLTGLLVSPELLADDLLVLKPPLVTPSTKFEDAELQAKYDTVWADYRRVMDKAWGDLGEEIESQRSLAQASGKLKLLEFWIQEKDKHTQRKELNWDPISWRKKWKELYDSTYPTRAGDSYVKYFKTYATARNTLDTGYSKVVTEVTKAGDVARAKALQVEASNLASISAPQTKQTPKGPKDGAIDFKGHKYKFFPESLAWNEAKVKCEGMGGHLLCIETADEQEFVLRWLPEIRRECEKSGIKGDFIWLGASDVAQEGTWKWIDGTGLTFTAWRKGEPNNSYDQDYASIHMTNGSWGDGDGKHSWPIFFVCEWDE